MTATIIGPRTVSRAGRDSLGVAKVWSSARWMLLLTLLACTEAGSVIAAECVSAQDGGAPQIHRQLRVVAYVASWSVPPVIHPEHLTHINFAFAHIDAAGRAVFEQSGVGQSLQHLQALKKLNPQLKIIIS